VNVLVVVVHEKSSPLEDRRHGIASTNKIRLSTGMWLVRQSREFSLLSEVLPLFAFLHL
jgi:hypothetical protein